MISVIFPAYNEEGNVRELHERIVKALTPLYEPFEIIAINNASVDRTREILLSLRPLTIISFAYNIGQTAALDAGIHHATGDIIIIIDADLQNDPTDIPKLIARMREGYDVVVGWRKDRHDPLWRRFFSRFANFITRRIAGISLHDYGCALRAFRRKDLEGLRLYGVMHVFLPVILGRRGARIAEVEVMHHERKSGRTKYSLSHMATDFADLLTIKFLYGYALRPLVFFGSVALVCVFLAVFTIIASVFFKFYNNINYSQTPLPVITALLFIVGFLLLMMGFMTELLIRIYYESRRETPYKIIEVMERK